MQILCGVDIIEIDRIKKSLEMSGESFTSKVYTRPEIDYCEMRKASKYKSYAARFAAKEAVVKALGTGIAEGISWRDIEVINDKSGCPHVVLYNNARQRFEELKGAGISISLSHCDSHAVAYVTIYTYE